VGFILALLAFFLTYLPVRAKAGPVRIVVLTGFGLAVVLVMANALNLNFPGGLLQDAYRLPWPLR